MSCFATAPCGLANVMFCNLAAFVQLNFPDFDHGWYTEYLPFTGEQRKEKPWQRFSFPYPGSGWNHARGRAFEDADVVHVEDRVDPVADLDIIHS